MKYYYCPVLGYEKVALKKLSGRYAVDVEYVGDGINHWSDADYWDGYNTVSIGLLERHFGKDVWAECFSEAREEFERRLQNKH